MFIQSALVKAWGSTRGISSSLPPKSLEIIGVTLTPRENYHNGILVSSAIGRIFPLLYYSNL